MSTPATASELKQLLKLCMKMAALPDGKSIRIPMAVHGTHGIGKTEVVKACAIENGYNPVILNLSTQDIADLVGIPYRDTSTGVTRFAAPDWFGDAIKDERPTLFFLDEMNRAEPYVLQTMLPFCLEGRIHTHKIRPGDIVVSAMNPDNSDYSVTAISDKALLSRFMHVYFEPTMNDWLDYNRSQKIHFSIIQSVEQSANILGKVAVPEKEKIRAVPDRRKFTLCGKALNEMSGEDFRQIGFQFLSGMVGPDAASIIATQYNTGTTLTSADIYSGEIFTKAGKGKSKEVRMKFDPKSDMDKVNILMDQLADDICSGRVVDIGTLAITEKYTNLAGKTVDVNIENVDLFVQSLPTDTQVGYIKRVKQKFIDNGVAMDKVITVLSKMHKQDYIINLHKLAKQFEQTDKKSEK